MQKLYIANKNYSSWSLRPWVLMTELGIPFDEQLIIFGDADAWAQFRQISPTGLVPCLIDDAKIVWDSLAIIEYLAEQYPAVWPTDKTARAWARSAAAEMHSGFSNLRSDCSMSCGVRVKLHSISLHLAGEIERLHAVWLEGLTRFGGPFLSGDKFTAVDAFYAPMIFRIQSYAIPLTQASQNYTQLMLSLDSMQSWYQDGVQEVWRDPSHEASIQNMGEIVSDMRSTV